MFQGFRFSKAGKGFPENGLDEVKNLERDLTIRFHPVSQVFPKFRMKNSLFLHGVFEVLETIWGFPFSHDSRPGGAFQHF